MVLGTIKCAGLRFADCGKIEETVISCNKVKDDKRLLPV